MTDTDTPRCTICNRRDHRPFAYDGHPFTYPDPDPEPDTAEIAALRDTDTGELPAYAWPGGYPMIYYTGDGLAICPKCANNPEVGDPPIMAEVYWEGPPIVCEDQRELIESAYGDPEAGRTQ